MNIRDLVYEKQNEIYNKDLTPERATELLRECSALVGNVNTEIREATFRYSKVLQQARRVHKSAIDAKIAAECSPEWMAKREAEDLGKLLKELIASLKYMLKNLQDEKWASKNL